MANATLPRLLCFALYVLVCAFPQFARGESGVEKPKVVIAVGGKTTLFYLPLALADRLGYFKAEGLEPEIPDFAGGAKSLQALVGGSADVVAGGFDHTIVMQTMAQKLTAFVLMGSSPGISMGVSKARAASYSWPKDLKGMKVGVTAPGSTTNMMLDHLLGSAGLATDDVSVIGVGTGPSAVAAMKGGQIDALINVEPAMTVLEKTGAMKIVAETSTQKGVRDVFGGPMLAGCLYTKAEFIRANPKTVQAMTNAIVRALKWIQATTPEQLAAALPPEYLLGDKALYLEAFQKVRPTYSADGLFAEASVQHTYKVLAAHNPSVRRAPVLWLEQTYENKFVQAALKNLK